MRRIILVAVALFAGYASMPAYACDGYHPIPEPEFMEASAVFSGEVINKTERLTFAQAIRKWLGWTPDPSSFDQRVTVRVRHTWKGVTDTMVMVTTPGWDCGFPFEVGGNYLIYSEGPMNDLKTTTSHRTIELA
ncbi:MAG TPA: hypothetical protein VFY29_08240, partial [Terriglobia bacterium]|nr:hypothetical protein [Terriglobia bacterium]